jgi:excisionase family DNA binding protein
MVNNMPDNETSDNPGRIDPGIYNLDQLSVQLGVHKTALRELISSKKLRARKIGKRFFVSRTALEEYVNAAGE